MHSGRLPVVALSDRGESFAKARGAGQRFHAKLAQFPAVNNPLEAAEPDALPALSRREGRGPAP